MKASKFNKTILIIIITAIIIAAIITIVLVSASSNKSISGAAATITKSAEAGAAKEAQTVAIAPKKTISSIISNFFKSFARKCAYGWMVEKTVVAHGFGNLKITNLGRNPTTAKFWSVHVNGVDITPKCSSVPSKDMWVTIPPGVTTGFRFSCTESSLAGEAVACAYTSCDGLTHCGNFMYIAAKAK